MSCDTRDANQHDANEGVTTVEMEWRHASWLIRSDKSISHALLVVSDYAGLEKCEEYLHAHSTERGLLKSLAIAQTVLSS